MHKKSVLLTIVLLVSGCSWTTPSENSSPIPSDSSSSSMTYTNSSYKNPLKFYKQDGSQYFVSAADPDILLGADGYYYLYITNTYCEMGTQGMVYDRGPIFRSTDMVHWTWIGSVFDGHPNALNWGKPTAGVWGPSVIRVGDRYNYYYSLSTWGDDNPGVGVATSSTPYGPWTHYGKVVDSTLSGVKNSIDPKAFYVGDDLYLAWGSFFGIGAIRLTDDGTEPFYGIQNIKEHLVWLIEDNSPGEMDINVNYEGTYVVEKDGQYFYFGSQGTCCSGRSSTYRVKTGKASSFFGPYYGSDGETLTSAKGTYGDLVVGPSDSVAGTGHNAVIQDREGIYWLLYHGYDINGEYPDERTLFLDRLYWDPETGMPYVENYVASIGIEKNGPLVAVI